MRNEKECIRPNLCYFTWSAVCWIKVVIKHISIKSSSALVRLLV